MDSEQRRKRKQLQQTKRLLLPLRFLVLCCSCFISVLYVSSGRFSVTSSKLRPVLASSDVSLMLTASSVVSSAEDFGDKEFRMVRVKDRVLFPDHVLLFVPSTSQLVEEMECVYRTRQSQLMNSTGGRLVDGDSEVVTIPVVSTDEYDEFRSIVRCPLPRLNYSPEVGLRMKEMVMLEEGRGDDYNQSVHSWDMVAYEAVLDGETAVVFVKGLNLRVDRVSDPTHFSCHFGLGKLDRNETFVLSTKAISAAQEAVRCALPPSIRNNPDKAQCVRVAVGVDQIYHGRILNHTIIPSVAAISRAGEKKKQVRAKYEMCVCTMVWNQAFALREWVMYHSWLGVERWFIYDNNSDDEIKDVISELQENEYHVSRHTWPWIKTQEAGFSHCVIRAKDECNWVGFFDVDEFFYFPVQTRQGRGINELSVPRENSLRNLVANYSSSETVGELRTACHSFGPSGLHAPPQGVTTGYTCRLQSPERHKSIVRPDALHSSLLNIVHHFHLKERFRYKNVLQSTSLINHYKYQVWDVFKAKFYRRVATYVADWQENQNEGSKDRAPGLGTEAIEPPNWHLQFCEVWDTGLRDIVLANLGDSVTGKLPWERIQI
uniref:Glycosyltransferase family 92 protein n=1 Tax=Kalanchoe fedtschenkoi TaxID=63787 RepID=A0A7N0U0S2_KALFE